MPRWLVAVLVALALVAAAGLGWRFLMPAAETTVSAQQGTVPIGGPFSLIDQNGRRVTDQDFRGRFMLVYFGYTFCPDVCPLGLQTIAQAMDGLPQDVQDQVVPIFVTVDPARDTVEVVRSYVQAFHPKLVGLTGSEAEIGAAVRAYRVYARKAEPKDGAYLVDHSTFTYLMDREGRYLAHFGHGTTPEEMARRIADLVRAS